MVAYNNYCVDSGYKLFYFGRSIFFQGSWEFTVLLRREADFRTFYKKKWCRQFQLKITVGHYWFGL